METPGSTLLEDWKTLKYSVWDSIALNGSAEETMSGERRLCKKKEVFNWNVTGTFKDQKKSKL